MKPTPFSPPSFLAAVAAICVGGNATGQCSDQWHPGGGSPGVDGEIKCSVRWDPDGPGPLGEHLVIAGRFVVVGTIAASNLAMQDLATGQWSAFGTGADNFVTAMTVASAGELIIAGGFEHVDGVATGGLARFDGSTWSGVGTDIPPNIAVVHEWDGKLVIGGSFADPAINIAAWDGTAWTNFGAGLSSWVRSLVTMPNGDLVAGGSFQSSGSQSMPGLARWDVNSGGWTAFSPGPTSVQACVSSGGDLYIASAAETWRWHNAAWTQIANPFTTIYLMTASDLGDVLAYGYTNSNGYVARLDGASTWTPLPGSIASRAFSITALPLDEIAIAGDFKDIDGVPMAGLARWDGTQWSPPSTAGTNGAIRDLARLPDGDLIAVGSFTRIGGVAANRVARWDGTSWSPLGPGFDLEVRAVELAADGTIVVGGHFYASGSVSVRRIARWDGASWSQFGTIPSQSIDDMKILPDGTVVTIQEYSNYYFQTWDGTSWSLQWAGQLRPKCLALRDDGVLFAGGNLGVARLDGATWTMIGTGARVDSIDVATNGDVVAGGNFSVISGVSASYIARWDGSSWHDLAGGCGHVVTGVHCHADGSVFAAGVFEEAGGVPTRHLARFRDGQWSEFGGGVSLLDSLHQVFRITSMPGGDLMLFGQFGNCGDTSPPSPFLARYALGCPSEAIDLGGGCAGSGGDNLLTGDVDPFLGGSLSTTGTDLPAFAFIMAVTGFAPLGAPMALSTLLPEGAPGCELSVSADVVDMLISDGGSVEHDIAIPDAPALVGMSVWQQLVPVEVTTAIEIVEATSSNVLRFTIGSL